MRRVIAAVLLLSAYAFALDKQPTADYRARRVALSEKTNGAAILLFAATEAEGQNATYGFRQDNNFFYVTGWTEPGAAVLIMPAFAAKDGKPSRAYTEILFLPARNVTQENWTGPKLNAASPTVTKLTGFDRVETLDRLRDELVRLLPSPRATVFSDLASYGEASTAAVPLDWLRRANAFPNYISFADAKPLVAQLRMRKDAGEMERIRRATDATVAGVKSAVQHLRPGAPERRVAAQFMFECMRAGGEGTAFNSIVGSGANSTVLHYGENAGTMQAGDTIVIDVGCEYSMYGSDMTRTFPVSGKWTPRQREIYEIVLGAQQAAMDAFRPGKFVVSPTSPQSLYKVAYDYINTHGKDKKGEPLGKYFIHGLSHHLGLETHDAADGSATLGPGMVFSIEPGIYIPEENIGVRIEDLFWVSPEGKLIRLTEAMPRAAAEIEALMNQNSR